jgi:phospho-N-acetylmuramoyl-pentapeptide-transferase
MLYELYNIFNIHIFHYLTVRAGFAFFIALIFTLFAIPRFIQWAIVKKFEQPIYELVTQHKAKSKIPTMGGTVFVVATIIATIISANLNNIYVLGGIMTLAIFSIIGMSDDLGKILGTSNKAGLSAKYKLYFQILASLFIGLALYLNGFPTELYVPFLKNSVTELGWLIVPFVILVFVSSSNAVNLTDGLDGLATVPSIFAIVTMGIFAYLSGNVITSTYLLLPHISGIGEIVVMASALAGALLGFLWYNSHPAEIFMGDSGSLALGGFIGYMAIITKNEILLILIGLIFVIEAMTVIIQVTSYKTRKKRIFLMAPIHHHFEKKNWHESKIIIRFWIVSLLSNLLALMTLKIR